FAQFRGWLTHPRDAQRRNRDTRQHWGTIRQRRQPRQSCGCTQPDKTVAVAKGGVHFSGSKAVGAGELSHLAGIYIDPVYAAARACVDAAGTVFRERENDVAGEAIVFCVPAKSRLFRIRMVESHEARLIRT